MKVKAFVTLLVLFIGSFVLAQPYQYGAPVTLEGTLLTSTADASITFDEKAHDFPALKLDKPISVLCSHKETDCTPETGVILLQLVLRPQQMEQFKKLKGKSVKVRGTLFHSDNGHHFTSVLIDVQEIIS